VLSGPKLQFPELLRQAGIEGRVLVQAIVDTLVEPNRTPSRLLQSPNPASTSRQRTTFSRLCFAPRACTRAVRVLIQIPVNFRKS